MLLRARVLEAAARRRWALSMSLATVCSGLLYSFAWAPAVRHQSAWVTPGDLWATFRAAHYVAWGALADIYGAHSFLVSFPGIAILLAPVSMLTSALGLSEGYPIGIAHPTAWMALGPAILLMAAVPLLGLDALAEARGASGRCRARLSVVEAAVLWILVAYWGHPEDAVALGLVAYALASAYRGSWRSCGWLLGAAVVMQPLSLLAFPAIVGWAPGRSRAGLTVRTALPASILLSFLFLADFPDTWSVLIRQPNYPTVNHPTPWVWLSPSLGPRVVGAGPGRVMAVVAAMLIGVWAWRRSSHGVRVDLVWLVAVAFAGRCFFEPVMVPFYLCPALAVAALLAAEKGSLRLMASGALAVAVTVVAHTRAAPLQWWLIIVALLATCLAVSAVPRASSVGRVGLSVRSVRGRVQSVAAG